MSNNIFETIPHSQFGQKEFIQLLQGKKGFGHFIHKDRIGNMGSWKKLMYAGSEFYLVVVDGARTKLPMKVKLKTNLFHLSATQDSGTFFGTVYNWGYDKPSDLILGLNIPVTDLNTLRSRGLVRVFKKAKSALKFARYCQQSEWGATTYDPHSQSCECCSTDVLLEEPEPDFESVEQAAAITEPSECEVMSKCESGCCHE